MVWHVVLLRVRCCGAIVESLWGCASSAVMFKWAVCVKVPHECQDPNFASWTLHCDKMICVIYSCCWLLYTILQHAITCKEKEIHNTLLFCFWIPFFQMAGKWWWREPAGERWNLFWPCYKVNNKRHPFSKKHSCLSLWSHLLDAWDDAGGIPWGTWCPHRR